MEYKRSKLYKYKYYYNQNNIVDFLCLELVLSKLILLHSILNQ